MRKGKALRKYSLHWKTAASVLLKLFISGSKTYSSLCTIFFKTSTITVFIVDASLRSYVDLLGYFRISPIFLPKLCSGGFMTQS